MKTVKAARERGVEMSIAMREREIAALEREKNELQSFMASAKPRGCEDQLLASFPVLDYCGRRPRKSIKSISVEQYGNIMIQLDIAKKAIDSQNQKDRADVQLLNRLIREQEKEHKMFLQKTKKISEKAGINLKWFTDRQCADAMRLQDYKTEVSLAELEARKRLVEHEVKAAKAIVERKGAAIITLTNLVEKRRSTIDEVDALYNQIRVVDRDTIIAKEELERLNADMQDADAWLEARPNPSESLARKIIDEDYTVIKGEKEQTVNEQRVPQERVIKAQDYRIAQLEERAKVVEKALKSNGLSHEVDRIVALGSSLGELEVPESQEELYDIEKIIPAQEQIHPGIYNLLLTEKERAARTVSILTISAKEKEEVTAELTTRLERLAGECTAAIQELDNCASELVASQEQQRVQALKWVREERKRCLRLFHETELFAKSTKEGS
ncbi:conserved hypothetical protein [Leishmania braziliensis MHOM/BR/75/M2904]|uniref:Uncharacterized protein n=2 Tax=Leishmania braziliensis TaxID=5660 RepID=A4HIV4_LEIBR|nr:conserved hypothetical protein [Leishmania braziliensis MHOM/BR/75/M2904]KAI5689941.1 hypothetical protein MNV84_06119 [Leishmania braziliensis]CAJ2477508.1 unnamed protein product [Leishmania braziliensis]CAJ2478031.1 unnamed protein product [Leishmania braziliensis]CAM40520.1 conserved hypothetical protein [Leishmania braziliensis MHOM/BR/75/M2904]SYZ68189.1 hypothetical_protein [Leishmania braziliensis MHOM/BR/75/M2904]